MSNGPLRVVFHTLSCFPKTEISLSQVPPPFSSFSQTCFLAAQSFSFSKTICLLFLLKMLSGCPVFFLFKTLKSLKTMFLKHGLWLVEIRLYNPFYVRIRSGNVFKHDFCSAEIHLYSCKHSGFS